ncbi:MAG: hypothetical protein LIR50_20250 [Bacillota bacterium]|nr:hypothetical protein [Bacillota bacterium]
MSDLKLTQSFSMIALNAQNSIYMTTVKKVALRCMAASVILEAYLDSFFTGKDGQLTIQNDALNQSGTGSYWEPILKYLLYKNPGVNRELKWWLKKASMLPQKQLVILEHKSASSLKEINLLEEIPNLLGCDLYYATSGVTVKEYRSNIKEYTRITEGIRAEILEDGPVADETICMLWLLRESGCMHDFFSRNEIEKAAARMNELYQNNSLAKALFSIHIYRGIELGIKEFLRLKKSVMTTPFGSGINFAFPILQRSQSIFIDTEAWFSNSDKRLEDLKKRLSSNGHQFIVLHEGPIPTIKIDNIIYEAIPQAVNMQVPIHGVRLLPKHTF